MQQIKHAGPSEEEGPPAFADVATAADGDGSCISDLDLSTYFDSLEAWNEVPAEYTQDGCIDEDEWNSLVSGGFDGSSGGSGNSDPPPGTVLCPGMAASKYCDCGGDCSDNPDWCACAEAQACCI